MGATRSTLRADLAQLGVSAGDVLMVHASLRAVGPVIGGANTVVQALRDAVGPEGTLVAYVDFEPFYEDDEPDPPVFDKRTASAARDHGILHEVLRNWPGTLRSDHPDAGVVALGAHAAALTADHPFQYGYGPGTPLARVVEANGKVLMLGAPLDTITLLHYAEHLADIPGKRLRRYRRLMPGPRWVDFEEFDTADPVHDKLPPNCFEQIAVDYLASGRGVTGPVGESESSLFDAAGLVSFAVSWIERRVKE